jgi:ABC-type nitrate/sulfonate/bicarbonate transport system permease component
MKKLFKGNGTGIATVAALLVVWQIVSLLKHTVYVPPVTTILWTFVKEWLLAPTFLQQGIPSLERMAGGYFFASLFGVVVGVVIGSFKQIYSLLDPVLQFCRAIPATAIIPVGILLIGIGWEMKVVVIAFGACWPILINSADGARLVPTERLDTARIFGLNPFETLIRVIVPSASPMIAAGMRTGLSIAFIMIVVSEMIGSTDGLGYYILQEQRTFAIPEMYAGIGLLAILGYLLNVGFVAIERNVLAWHYGQSARTT